MSQPSGAPRQRPPRWLLRVGGGAIVTLGLLVAADTTLSIVAEAHLSSALEQQANLPASPRVTVSGPFLRIVATGTAPSIVVQATDLDATGFGLVSVTTRVAGVTVDAGDLLAGRLSGAPARTYLSTLRLDGVALGGRLGISDLVIANHRDISPKGSWETEADLTGTLPDFAAPATVRVRLRIVDGAIRITPTEVISGPADTVSTHPVTGRDIPEPVRSALLEGFALVLPGGLLPLESGPTRIYVSGGAVGIEGEQRWVTTDLADLVPRARDVPEDEQPG